MLIFLTLFLFKAKDRLFSSLTGTNSEAPYIMTLFSKNEKASFLHLTGSWNHKIYCTTHFNNYDQFEKMIKIKQ